MHDLTHSLIICVPIVTSVTQVGVERTGDLTIGRELGCGLRNGRACTSLHLITIHTLQAIMGLDVGGNTVGWELLAETIQSDEVAL